MRERTYGAVLEASVDLFGDELADALGGVSTKHKTMTLKPTVDQRQVLGIHGSCEDSSTSVLWGASEVGRDVWRTNKWLVTGRREAAETQ